MGAREFIWWKVLAELEAGGPEEERRRRAIAEKQAQLAKE